VTEQGAVPMIVMTRSQDHVEAINSTLRKAGHPVHCTWLPDARDLSDAITQLNPEMLVAFIEELGIDLASIMKIKQQTAPGNAGADRAREQVDESAIAEAMRLGAQDVVTLANRSRLQSVVTRELRAYRLERALSTTLSSAREYREQLQKFLEGSADAITHVQEGIIVDANRAWLELFGYSGDDALTGTPLMDLFEQETHPALKGALVACLQGKWSDMASRFRRLAVGRLQLAAGSSLTKADYENEPATRISIPANNRKDHDLEVQLADAVKNDVDGLPAAALSRGRGPRALHSPDEGRRAPVRLRQTGPLLGDSSGHRRALERGFHGAIRRARAHAADRDRSVRPIRRQRISDPARPRHGARRRDLGRERSPAHRRPHVPIRRKEPLGNRDGGVGAPAPDQSRRRRPPSPTR
jgi:PAS domain S-box-containing protein